MGDGKEVAAKEGKGHQWWKGNFQRKYGGGCYRGKIMVVELLMFPFDISKQTIYKI